MNGEQGMQTNGNEVIIETHNLKKLYQMGSETIHALAGVDMQIRRNEYIAIMGPSGSGKSTLMNLIGCLDTPSEGEYVLNGTPVPGSGRRRARADPESRDRLRVPDVQPAAAGQRAA